MKKQMSYYLEQLEKNGIDTSRFHLECNGVVLKVEDLMEQLVTPVESNNFNVEINLENSKLEACLTDEYKKSAVNLMKTIMNHTVPDTYIQTSSDLFRKFGCLCLNWRNQETKNKKHKIEKGYDAYVRNELSYMFQFEFILNYLKPSTGSFYEVAKKFFTRNVLIDLCRHAINKQNDSDGEVYVICNEFETWEDKELLKLCNELHHTLDNIWVHEFKCQSWKDAFKGLMSYCAIDYLIKQNKITTMTLIDLQKLLNNEEFMNKPYKFYQLLNKLTEGMDI